MPSLAHCKAFLFLSSKHSSSHIRFLTCEERDNCISLSSCDPHRDTNSQSHLLQDPSYPSRTHHIIKMGIVDKVRGLGLGMVIWILAVPIFLFTRTQPDAPHTATRRKLTSPTSVSSPLLHNPRLEWYLPSRSSPNSKPPQRKRKHSNRLLRYMTLSPTSLSTSYEHHLTRSSIRSMSPSRKNLVLHKHSLPKCQIPRDPLRRIALPNRHNLVPRNPQHPTRGFRTHPHSRRTRLADLPNPRYPSHRSWNARRTHTEVVDEGDGECGVCAYGG